MPEREILLAGESYVDEKGVNRFGLQGETVNVHDDDVKRFDEFNVDPGPPFEPMRVPTQMVSPDTPEGESGPKKAAPAKKAT